MNHLNCSVGHVNNVATSHCRLLLKKKIKIVLFFLRLCFHLILWLFFFVCLFFVCFLFVCLFLLCWVPHLLASASWVRPL